MRLIFTIFLICISTGISLSQAAFQAELIGEYVSRVQQAFDVPGLGIAIVKDGEVKLATGFGIKEIASDEAVDDQTLFGIASNTKAFTATALAILVEEGKLEWEGRVIDYLPWFRLSDPYVTNELTIRDLLVHRSGLGLGAGDLLWWPASTYDRREIVFRLRHVPLKTSFRSAYAYDNVLYTVAGEVIAEVTGTTWEQFVQERILDPVGMTASDVRHSAGNGEGNIAIPHAFVDGQLKKVKPFTSDNVNPAGGIHSNARDMARWMIVQLDSGRLADGGRLVAPQSIEELWKPVTPKPIPNYSDNLAPMRMNFYFYALGFNVCDYHGKKMLFHGGSLPGYLSRVAMIPEEKIGVAVLTNQESDDALDAIVYHVLDNLLGVKGNDWLYAVKAESELHAEATAAIDIQKAAARDRESKPSLDLGQYAGVYRDAWYGDIEISTINGQLEMRFSHTPDLTGILEHWQFDTFAVRWYDRSLRGDAFIIFALDENGQIDHARMEPFSPSVDFSFDYQDLLLKPVK